MKSLSATEAHARLDQLLDEATESHEPIPIVGERSSAVLISADNWRGIQETLELLAISGLRDSIFDGMAEPLSKSSSEPGW